MGDEKKHLPFQFNRVNGWIFDTKGKLKWINRFVQRSNNEEEEEEKKIKFNWTSKPKITPEYKSFSLTWLQLKK